MDAPHEPDAATGGAADHPYDRHYFDTALGPVPYDRRYSQWTDFFATIADHVVAEIKPRSVLDVGCAKGFLVEALRDRGVEAFGIDISEYAIGEVRPDIRPYCRVASATEPFRQRYDLIVCIEVLEHLDEADGRRAIANIGRSAGDVLFSSTPDDFTEPTHVNVRPRSWWIERFAEHGLMLDVAFDAGFVSAHAMRFRAGQGGGSLLDPLLAQRHQLLRALAALRIDVEGKDGAIGGLQAAVAQLSARRDRLQSDLTAVQRGAEALRNELTVRRLEVNGLRQEGEQLREAVGARDELIASLGALRDALQGEVAGLERSGREKDDLIAGLNYHLLSVQRTIGWKLLERLRRVRDRVMPADSRRRDLYWRIRRPLEVYLDEGLLAFVRKAKYKVRLRWQGREFLVKAPPARVSLQDPGMRYQIWLRRHQPGRQDLARMKTAVKAFACAPVISVLTPVYDTDEVWLRKAIESVRAQIYPHWELCLVNDGSTRPHVKAILDEYAAAEPRVRVEHLSRNQGIAGASAHGLRLATGDYVALLDHDDELPPEALFEVVKRLNEDRDVDLIYTDEDKLEPDGQRVEPFFKPDWSPDLLLSMNYITHLSVFRRSLLEEIGGFRLGLDGSQDYDLLLRASERARRIAHIPQILYHWRKAPGSAAASTAAKPHAYEAARQAIESAVRRRGHEAQVNIVLPGLYSVRYRLKDEPLISIIIPTRDRWSLLRECVRSIEEKTRYLRYEIIVLDNDSTDPEARQGLSAIADRWRVHPCPGPFNFSALNNFGAAQARGDYLVFLNNDTQVVEPDWLAAMLEQSQRPEVGAVGARLHYPDGRIQHAGLVLGVGGVADHAFKGLPGNSFTYFAFASVVRNVSAVTAACMMVPRAAFEEVKGFDERLQVALNDVDLCLRLRQRGYLIVYTPHALLYHHESGTRGGLHPPGDEELVWTVWGDLIRKGDPYYNPNLTLTLTDWSLAV
jgi:GT2 family glycosyltransferase/SAM-dependent methyltransferase